MIARSIALRLALAAVALGGLSGWKLLIDGPTRRTRMALEIQHKIIELYRRIHGHLPTPRDAILFMMAVSEKRKWDDKLFDDGWGRSMWICLRGDTLVLLSLGPNGVDDGGGVDDLSIEIEP